MPSFRGKYRYDSRYKQPSARWIYDGVPPSRLPMEGDRLHSPCGDSWGGRVWADVVGPRDKWGGFRYELIGAPPVPPIVIL